MAGLLERLFGTAQRPRPRADAPPGRATEAQLALGRQIYQYFVERGLQPHQAAAIAGNMVWEGGGRTDLVYSGEDGRGDNPRHAPEAPHSMGIAQWNGSRARGLIEYARSQGIDIPEGDLRDAGHVRTVISRIPLATQLGFAWQEMQGPEARAYAGIQGGTDLRTSMLGAIGYHRPRGWTRDNPEGGDRFDARLSLADAILRGGPLHEGYTVPPPTAPPPSAPPPDTPRGLLTGVLEGTPFAGLGSLLGQTPPPPPPGQQPPPDLADLSRRRADALLNPPPGQEEGSGIQGVQLPQLDLTRLRALMQRRGMLGSA